jgi:hypothetical protein
LTGDDGRDGPKPLYILIEALAGREDEVVRMLRRDLGPAPLH